MKKIILLAATLTAMLSMTSCTNKVEDTAKVEDTVNVENYMDMVEVCYKMNKHILYDNNTGVLYYQYCFSNSHCGLTPIYNNDGTLKIYEEWVDKK